MTEAEGLEGYLSRPVERPQPDVAEAIGRGPMDPDEALAEADLDRLLAPEPVAVENGWCTLGDGVGYVAIRTAMPRVTGPMVDWWFDWHPEQAIRYRIWHPPAHEDNSIERPEVAGAKPHWNTVHHPVEDVGTGTAHARIAFRPPSEIGFSSDALEDPGVATIVGGEVGDDRLRVRHSRMVHVFLREGDGVVLRSRFWLGSALRPYLPGALAALGGALMNNRLLRRVALPSNLPEALANHCAEEYTNLAALLPELYPRYALG